jgi:hypothetical protein
MIGPFDDTSLPRQFLKARRDPSRPAVSPKPLIGGNDRIFGLIIDGLVKSENAI